MTLDNINKKNRKQKTKGKKLNDLLEVKVKDLGLVAKRGIKKKYREVTTTEKPAKLVIKIDRNGIKYKVFRIAYKTRIIKNK